MTQESVAIAIVTHNRFECLQRLLMSIRSLNHAVHSVWIVDNSSSDGTPQKIQNDLAPNFHLIELKENRGGAGGFNVAIGAASRSGADWVWIMDDDVLVRPDGLDRLLTYKNESLCIHGVRLQPDGQVLPFEQWMNPRNCFTDLSGESSFRSGKKVCPLNVGCFEGMLIHRSIIEKIGLPDPTFFLTEDDAYYGYLASKQTNVLYVNEVTMSRQLSRPVKSFFMYRTYLSAPEHHLYYFIRNKFLMYRKLRKDGVAHPVAFSLRLARYVFRMSLLYGVYERNPRKVVSAFKGVLHGMQGRFGPMSAPEKQLPARNPQTLPH